MYIDDLSAVLDRLREPERLWFRGRRCLVTGGAGFIGSWLAEALVRLGAEVHIADNLWRGRIENLRDAGGTPFIDLEGYFHNVDLREYHACLETALRAEVVYHLADIVGGIQFVFANEPFVFRTNILINSNMIAAAREVGASSFIYAGTACSYPKVLQSKPGGAPLREEQAYPADPESAYGWSKLMGEFETELLGRTSEVKVGVLRLHNVYGPRCDMSPKRSQVIPSLIRKAMRYPAEPFVVWGSGKQTRAFVYVADVVDALLRLTTRGMGQGVIQIGTEVQTSIADLAQHIVQASGKRIEVEFDTSKPEGDVGRSGTWAKANKVLGWEPSTPLQAGIAHTYTWAARGALPV